MYSSKMGNIPLPFDASCWILATSYKLSVKTVSARSVEACGGWGLIPIALTFLVGRTC